MLGSVETPPPPLNSVDRSKTMPGWFVFAMTLVALGFVFIFWSQWNFASYLYALEYIQGSRIQLRTPLQQVGIHRPGEHFDAEVRITNHDTKPTTIVGALSDCSCVATQALPKDIAPGETVAIRFGSDPGDWRKHVAYLTNNPRQPQFDVELVGRIASH